MDYSNGSEYDNSSFSFLGPLEIVMINDDNTALESTEIKIVFSVLLFIIMIMSIIGNISTCIVIFRDHSMWTPTNAYLLNLAVTDMLLSLTLPLELYLIWIPQYYPLGEIGCYIHWLLLYILIMANVMTISAFTIERYLVISKPFLRHSLSKMSRMYKIIALIWIITGVFCLPEIFTVEFLQKKKFVYCFSTMSNLLRIYFVAVQMCLFFIVPMVMITVLYTLIAIKLKRSTPVNGNQHRDKAVRMLGLNVSMSSIPAAVAGSFFFCWSPTAVMQMMLIAPQYRNKYYYDAWRSLHYLATLNAYLTTIINPILYSLMSRKFRRAFKEIFFGTKTVTQTRYDVGNT